MTFRSMLAGAAVALLRAVPPRPLEALVGRLVDLRSRGLAPADGLRLVLGVQSRLEAPLGAIAEAYDGGLHVKHRLTRYHDFFVRHVRAGERVLDVGCGNGFLAHDIAVRAGAKVRAIDIDPLKVARASARHAHPSIDYELRDVLSGPLGDPADVVVMSNVLEHLPGREALLARLARDLTPRAILVRVPLFDRDWTVPLKRELGLDWRSDPTHETEYTVESFAAEVAAAGLTIASQEIRWGEIWAVLAREPER